MKNKHLRAIASLILAFAMILAVLLPSTGAIAASSTTYSDGAYRYYYNQLSSNEKKAYRKIQKKLGDMPSKIEINSLTNAELSDVFEAIAFDNPEFFFLNNTCYIQQSGGKYYFVPTYNMTKSTYKSRLSKVQSAINKIVSTTKKKYSDNYSRERYVHDYLVNLADYTYNGKMKYTPYGCLINKQCNCEGYSRTFQWILKKLGIVNHLVTGKGTSSDGSSENHMWNAVTINGKEYNVDVTWDDSSSGFTFLFVRVGTGTKADPSHAYFNRSTAVMKRNHSAETSKVWGNCTDDSTQNYFRKNGTWYTSYGSSTKTSITNLLVKKAKAGRPSVEFAFSTKKAYNAAKKGLFTNSDINTIIKNANKKLSSSQKISSTISYSYDDQMYVIRLYI